MTAASAARGLSITLHDEPGTSDLDVVDSGLGSANDAAAPLHEVRPLASFLRDADGRVRGGAVGRRWGPCCELQQLWVEPVLRRQGLGARLVRAFEGLAREHGCTVAYLETFNFQAPSLYRSLGYVTVHEHAVYPHGIVRHLMVHALACPPQAADQVPQ